MALVRLLQFVIVVSCNGAIKNPYTGQGYRGLRSISLFSGIFNVARNLVTNRHSHNVYRLLQCGVKIVKILTGKQMLAL